MSNFLNGLMVAGITELIAIRWIVQHDIAVLFGWVLP
jgi:hypothetical protein